MEGLRLSVKDVDFDQHLIIVWEGNGNKDRITTFPGALVADLRRQLAYAKSLWGSDRAFERHGVETPPSVAKKYPRAGESRASVWVFPADHESVDRRSGVRRRHHLFEEALGSAIKRAAVLAGIAKPITTHMLSIILPRTSSNEARTFARSRSCSGAAMPNTTMINTHVVNRGTGVLSPLDNGV